MKFLTSNPQLLVSQSRESVLKVEELTYAYPRQQAVLKNISFNLNVGDRFALMGATGSGKSTLLENIIGLKQPQQGQVWIRNIPVSHKTLLHIRRHIGFGFQDANDQLFMPTVIEDITFGPRNYGVPPAIAINKAQQLLIDFGLESYANRSVHELSGGQRRLVALAAILALEPDILILDEPTTGLDPAWRRRLAHILLQLPIQAMLIASHDLNWLGKVTKKALVMAGGSIFINAEIEPLLKDSQTLERFNLPIGW